jgi:hypothetical protein
MGPEPDHNSASGLEWMSSVLDHCWPARGINSIILMPARQDFDDVAADLIWVLGISFPSTREGKIRISPRHTSSWILFEKSNPG